MDIKRNRRDFYYFLSKKYKFRSRAALKLIDINKKYKIFTKTHGVLDLCSAPGSWLQVAREFSPPSAYVIGIDASDILYINGCQTLKGDITSSGCLFTLSKIKIIKKKEIDVVLHDGAPRMGTTWIRDVFNQNDLALKAFKFAVHCLKKKGWFITKIFYSGNIQGFLFALRFFFEKIFICKPNASRKTSSETYVICKGFALPFKFEEILFDPIYIFGDPNIKKDFRIIEKSIEKNFYYKKCLSFPLFVRDKKKKTNTVNVRIYFNDEFFGRWGTGFFTSPFYYKKSVGNRTFRPLLFSFFLLICWIKFYLS